MSDLLFYIFATLTLMSGLMVVVSRNTVNGAWCMMLCLVGVAALFVLLEAYFLAALQVLVYAGAVVVLFLFIIMLLDINERSKLRGNMLTIIASATALMLLVFGVFILFGPASSADSPELQTVSVPAASYAKHFGIELFTKFLLPFQVAGFLLLIAVIGVVHLSKNRKGEL